MDATAICLKERARVRAVILGHAGAMSAIAAHFGTESTKDKRVKALWQVIAKGTPNHDRVRCLCEVFALPLDQAGFWFTPDENTWRRMAIQPRAPEGGAPCRPNA